MKFSAPQHPGRFMLALLLPLTLLGCGSDKPKPDDKAPAIAATDWSMVKPVDGVVAKLQLPATVPADAALVTGTATITNQGSGPALLTVPTPCDKHDWRLLDAKGQQVMRRHPVECVQQRVTLGLAAGGSLNEPVTLDLEPRVLVSGRQYTVDYRFWGQPAQTTFTANR